MKLLHYNVHMWLTQDGASNVAAVAHLIERTSPDVVSLVEVDETWGRPHALQEIGRRFDYNWVFVPAFEYREQGGFGNALMSRAPIRTVQQWQLLPGQTYDGTEPSEPRAVVFASIDVRGRDVWVGSTHLPRQDSSMRAAASKRLLEFVEGLDGPWVLAGDFNQSRSQWVPPSYKIIPEVEAPSYPVAHPTEPIDYCLLSGLTGEGELVQCLASDHLPLVATIDL